MNKAFLVELKCFGKKFFQWLVKEVVRCPENFSARCIERTVRSEADDTGRRRDDISDHFCIAEQIQWDRAVLLGTPVFGYFLVDGVAGLNGAVHIAENSGERAVHFFCKTEVSAGQDLITVFLRIEMIQRVQETMVSEYEAGCLCLIIVFHCEQDVVQCFRFFCELFCYSGRITEKDDRTVRVILDKRKYFCGIILRIEEVSVDSKFLALFQYRIIFCNKIRQGSIDDQ